VLCVEQLCHHFCKCVENEGRSCKPCPWSKLLKSDPTESLAVEPATHQTACLGLHNPFWSIWIGEGPVGVDQPVHHVLLVSTLRRPARTTRISWRPLHVSVALSVPSHTDTHRDMQTPPPQSQPPHTTCESGSETEGLRRRLHSS